MTVTATNESTPVEKPVILVAHPRSRSSAFERVFIQNKAHVDTLHEPFGDAYWLGSERQLGRYDRLRHLSGFDDTTYKSAIDKIVKAQHASHTKGKRLFIKEMAFFLFPRDGSCRHLASSFGTRPLEPDNPTLLPYSELERFQYTFLIRHPYYSVPSYYRLSLPGKKDESCVEQLTTKDLGYSELRQLFDCLLDRGIITQTPSSADNRAVCVVDAEEMLQRPEETMKAYCSLNGISFDQSALQWHDAQDQQRAAAVIDKWGFSVTFHDNVLQSKGLYKNNQTAKSWQQVYLSWVDEFGTQAADEIKIAADSQLEDFLYLKKFTHCL